MRADVVSSLARAVAVVACATGCVAAGGATSAPTRAAAGAPTAGAPTAADTIAAELLAAVDAQQLDSGLVRRALATPSVPVRRLAAIAIGQSRARGLAPRLTALLADADTGVAANAAFALGLLADTGSVAALGAALPTRVAVGAEAAWSLGEIGEPARDEIVRGLSTRTGAGQAAPVTSQLLYAASKLRPVPTARIVPHLASPVGAIRDAAAYALGRPRASDGVRALLDLAGDARESVRASVARGLARSAAGDSLAAPAAAALRRLARDQVASVRVIALRSLASYPADGPAAVMAATRDAHAHVRLTGAELAGDALGADSAGWVTLWAADTSFAYRRALLGSAGAHDQLGAEADAWARDADWRRRAAAAARHGARRPQPDRQRLRALVSDSDGRVRAAAYGAYAAAMDSVGAPSDARGVFIAALRDTDAVVRAGALDALSGRPAAAEAGAVLAAYRAAARDRDNDARLAALRYLAKLWAADSDAFSPDDRARLRALPTPLDPLERVAAGSLPLVVPPGGTVAAARPAGFYARIVRDVWRPGVAGRPPRVTLRTERGDIALELHAADAPLTVDNFLVLVRAGTFRDTRFHRVVPGFVAQSGDPRGDGSGGPGYAIRDEQNRRRYERGVVGMALSGPNTGGSQHFITLTPQPHLDGHYTVFGHVVDGYATLDRIVQGDRVVSARVE